MLRALDAATSFHMFFSLARCEGARDWEVKSRGLHVTNP